VLAASIRHLKHLLGSFASKADLVTAPSKVWEEWAASSFPLPGADFVQEGTDKADRPLKPIAYKSIGLNQAWEVLISGTISPQKECNNLWLTTTVR
jgi:hypothetical protein